MRYGLFFRLFVKAADLEIGVGDFQNGFARAKRAPRRRRTGEVVCGARRAPRGPLGGPWGPMGPCGPCCAALRCGAKRLLRLFKVDGKKLQG